MLEPPEEEEEQERSIDLRPLTNGDVRMSWKQTPHVFENILPCKKPLNH